MLVNADKFSALLHALGLTQGLFKPTPSLLASSGYTTGANGSDTLLQAYNFPVNVSNNLHAIADMPNAGDNIQNMIQQGASCHVDPYDITVDVQAFLPFDETKANVFRYRQQQSVNLGSWYASISSVAACSE